MRTATSVMARFDEKGTGNSGHPDRKRVLRRKRSMLQLDLWP
jgi:hypothetical protein